MYKYIHTCICIHISCPHTYTHTHIYTHAYKMYIWTHAKHIWNNGAAGTAREAQLDAKKLCPSPCPLQSGGGYPSWPAPQSPVHEKRREQPQPTAEQPQPTAAHRTITTARRPDHIRLSALVRSQSTHFTQAPSLAARPWPPETRSFFCHFGGFLLCYVALALAQVNHQVIVGRRLHNHSEWCIQKCGTRRDQMNGCWIMQSGLWCDSGLWCPRDWMRGRHLIPFVPWQGIKIWTCNT